MNHRGHREKVQKSRFKASVFSVPSVVNPDHEKLRRKQIMQQRQVRISRMNHL